MTHLRASWLGEIPFLVAICVREEKRKGGKQRWERDEGEKNEIKDTNLSKGVDELHVGDKGLSFEPREVLSD